jgi:hypothetical protein
VIVPESCRLCLAFPKACPRSPPPEIVV